MAMTTIGVPVSPQLTEVAVPQLRLDKVPPLRLFVIKGASADYKIAPFCLLRRLEMPSVNVLVFPAEPDPLVLVWQHYERLGGAEAALYVIDDHAPPIYGLLETYHVPWSFRWGIVAARAVDELKEMGAERMLWHWDVQPPKKGWQVIRTASLLAFPRPSPYFGETTERKLIETVQCRMP